MGKKKNLHSRFQYLDRNLAYLPVASDHRAVSNKSPVALGRRIFLAFLMSATTSLLILWIYDLERRMIWMPVFFVILTIVFIVMFRSSLFRGFSSLRNRTSYSLKQNLSNSEAHLQVPIRASGPPNPISSESRTALQVEGIGRTIGSRLAIQYRIFLKSKTEEKGALSLYDLIPDLEKDLNASFLSQQVPEIDWRRFSSTLGEKVLVDMLRQSAIESYLDVGSRFDKLPKFSTLSKNPSKRSQERGQGEKPGPRLHLDPTEFEKYCVEWAIFLGYGDSAVTRAVKDGGIDISSGTMVAQCKYQELPVGVKPIRELFGLSQVKKKKPLFFSLNGYTREAINEAEQFSMELWVVRPLEGKVERVGVVEQMNQGDHHSGPEGYSANTAYSETQYGSGFDEEADWNEEGR